MKKAWVQNNVIIDVCEGDPSLLYHPDISRNYYAEVPDDIVKGAVLVEGVWTNPEIPAVVETIAQPERLPLLSPVEFKLLFTPQERIAIKKACGTDAVVTDFFEILDDPRLTCVNLNLESTKKALEYLVTCSLITKERHTEIMTGIIR